MGATHVYNLECIQYSNWKGKVRIRQEKIKEKITKLKIIIQLKLCHYLTEMQNCRANAHKSLSSFKARFSYTLSEDRAHGNIEVH